MRTTLADLLLWGREQLEGLGDREARGSTECLLENLLETDRSSLYLNSGRRISEGLIRHFEEQIQKRKARVPVAYLTGKAYFWKESLEVGPGCFIPRPETERLVENVLQIFKPEEQTSFSFLDFGTGSGAIAIAILRSFESCEATLVDGSPEALFFAKKNLEKYGLTERASCVLAQDLSALKKRWDLIVSNPPYLSREEWIQAEPEVRLEPRAALEAGPDGCDFYRYLIREAPRSLKENGWLVMETGASQGGRVKALVERSGCFHSPRMIQDYSGLDRVVTTQLGF